MRADVAIVLLRFLASQPAQEGSEVGCPRFPGGASFSDLSAAATPSYY